MSIPERLYKIARYKLGEVKERFDQLDEEAQREWEERQQRKSAAADARRELDDGPGVTPSAQGNSDTSAPRSGPSAPAAGSIYTPPNAPAPPRRTPEEIARGIRPSSGVSPHAAYSSSNTNNTPGPATMALDPLLPYYRVFNLTPGADFAAVTAEYNRLAARSDPERFPAGSQEQETARQLRGRIEEAYQQLREALDPTARRFNLLDFEPPLPPENEDGK